MNSLKFKELHKQESLKSPLPGTTNKTSGIVVRVKITIDPEFTPIIPVVIPSLDEVRSFAQLLHQQNQNWQGSVFGWDAEYHASLEEPPADSKMTFTPAEFWIGDATIWALSMMWEDGDDKPASEAISDWNLVPDSAD